MKGRAGLRLQLGEDRPIFARDEFLDFEFAVADDAQRDRLHAPGRARAGQFAPQNRREREAHEIVERAARAISVHQRFVDLAGMAHRVLHRLLRHGVEYDPVDPLVLQELLAPEDLVDVPGDRLPLAVGVGGEDDAVGVLDGGADIVEALGGLGVDLPAHCEIIVGIDRAVLGREVAHVTERGVDVVILAQIFVDGLGLGRRLDDYDFHARQSLSGARISFERSKITSPGRTWQGAENGGVGAACQMGTGTAQGKRAVQPINCGQFAARRKRAGGAKCRRAKVVTPLRRRIELRGR